MKKPKHGHSSNGKRTPEYHVWHGMRQRCLNKNHKDFHHYGGRGIKICKRWDSFKLFLKDMGPRPEGKTLERKKVNGNYTPKNCTWATWSEQIKNRRKIHRRKKTKEIVDGHRAIPNNQETSVEHSAQ